jgi:hypothetical protein
MSDMRACALAPTLRQLGLRTPMHSGLSTMFWGFSLLSPCSSAADGRGAHREPST